MFNLLVSFLSYKIVFTGLLLGLFWRESREVGNARQRSVSCDTDQSSANQKVPFTLGTWHYGSEKILYYHFVIVGYRFFSRNIYLVFSYFWFFLGLPMAVFSAIFRILKATIVGALMLPRIDHSLMPDGFQRIDSGNQSCLLLWPSASREGHNF